MQEYNDKRHGRKPLPVEDRKVHVKNNGIWLKPYEISLLGGKKAIEQIMRQAVLNELEKIKNFIDD